MSVYEYSVIPAPERGEKAKGAKSSTERYAVALAAALNEMAAQGWEYLRAEALPSEERTGLTGRATVYHNVLVFRRALTEEPAYAAVQPNATRPFSQPMRSAEKSLIDPPLQGADAPQEDRG